MSSIRNTTPTPSTSNVSLDSALAEYYKHTGQALLDCPQVAAIDRCESQLDSILDLFREQSLAFDKYSSNGDPKLIDWLGPIVTKLLAIGKSEALGADTTLVSPTQFHILSRTYFHAYSYQALPPEKYVLYAISVLLSVRVILILTSKRSMTFTPARRTSTRRKTTISLASYLSTLKASLDNSRNVQNRRCDPSPR